MPDIYAKFRKHYEDYQREVVNQLAKNLLDCHKLIFLVDVTDVLGSGVQKYNDTKILIKDLLKYLESGSTFLNKALRSLKDFPRICYGSKTGWPEEIAFIASKADKVHKSDRDNLVPLLKDLASPIVLNTVFHKKTAYLSCISVDSSKSVEVEKKKVLIGKPLWKMDENGKAVSVKGGEECEFQVSTLPTAWPDNWQGSDYSFHDFCPVLPRARDKPPRQDGLNKIMEFILNLHSI